MSDELDSSLYDVLLDYVDNILLFEGKPLTVWKEEMKLPPVPDHIDNREIVSLNQKALVLSEIAYSNLSIAKARHTVAKAAFTKKINVSKESIRTLKDSSKIKASSDVIETEAFNKANEESTALTITEIFLDFWKHQVDKIDTFNTRLTSLNITVNQESKYLNSNNNSF